MEPLEIIVRCSSLSFGAIRGTWLRGGTLRLEQRTGVGDIEMLARGEAQHRAVGQLDADESTAHLAAAQRIDGQLHLIPHIDARPLDVEAAGLTWAQALDAPLHGFAG